MKIKAISIAFAIVGFHSIYASADTNINVHGVIEPKACSATVTGGTDLDWGTLSHDDLKQNDFTTLDKKPFTLQVACPDDAKMALWIADPKTDSALKGTDVEGHTGHSEMNHIFGLGLDPVTNNKLGNFVLNPVQTTVDGVINKTNFGHQSSDSHAGTTFTAENIAASSYNKTEDWTTWDNSKNSPAIGKNFLWQFDIEPQLNQGTAISSTQRIEWQGTAQINVRYF